MGIININTTNNSYDVHIGSGLLSRIGDMIPVCNVTLITDDIVDKLYADIVTESLRKHGHNINKFVFPNGEKSKTIATYQAILEFMTEHEMTRSDIIIALGGGVVGDIAGFAAATYLRGIKFISVPTTLLAAVDSSVGGKTAINLTAGKNQAGAFWQPELVICDTDTFKTLNNNTLADGYAEIIKYGMIHDFGSMNNIEEIVSRCIEIKNVYVADDVNDKGIRQILNFGHTIGHAVEKLSDYTITHGHAVAIGMVIITRSAVLNGLCSIECLSLLLNKLNLFNLPMTTEYNPNQLAAAAMSDKKRSGGDITIVVPVVSGECRLHTIKIDELAGFITSESIAVIKPHKLHGKINAIPSKSDIHRELICRFLAGDELSLPFDSDDVKATYNCLMNIRSGNNIIDCGESGTTLRFMLPLISALGLECEIRTSGRLSERPIDELHEICSGKLTSGTYKISGNITSQYVSALLLVLPILDGDSMIELTSPLESSAYVDMTLQKMKKFGVIAEKTDHGYFIRGNQRYVSHGEPAIESDWSSGAVWLSVGVECDGLDIDSLQPDKEILNIINKIGTEIDMSQCPDIVPITAVIAAVSNSTTVLKNIGRLRYKESDRLESVTQALKSLGADINIGINGDSLVIKGVSKLNGGIVCGFNDHRIIMAIAAASTFCDGDIIILGADSVKKSYPNFFSDFNKLGGEAYVI